MFRNISSKNNETWVRVDTASFSPDSSIMFQFIMEFFVDALLGLLWWVILLPVVWLASLPFILVISLFRPRRYLEEVWTLLFAVTELWRDYGVLIIP